jgi:cell division protein ZapB
MAAASTTDLIADRVERLLLRHEELQRTNALLLQQVQQLGHERDQLQAQCQAARQRLDALLARLPAAPADTDDEAISPGGSST